MTKDALKAIYVFKKKNPEYWAEACEKVLPDLPKTAEIFDKCQDSAEVIRNTLATTEEQEVKLGEFYRVNYVLLLIYLYNKELKDGTRQPIGTTDSDTADSQETSDSQVN